MTVIDFINRKNKILFDKTGYILVPEDQIKECEQVLLDFDSDATICPYCKIFYNDVTYTCYGCPMNNADNNCNTTNSTFRTVRDNLPYSVECNRLKCIPEIIDLVNQYNKELQEINASS